MASSLEANSLIAEAKNPGREPGCITAAAKSVIAGAKSLIAGANGLIAEAKSHFAGAR
jgi:hypothetical protein